VGVADDLSGRDGWRDVVEEAGVEEEAEVEAEVEVGEEWAGGSGELAVAEK
jgi:hypothetical protein